MIRTLRLKSLLAFGIFLGNFSLVCAEDIDQLKSLVSDNLKESFRIQETTKLTLDGSEAASNIQRTTQYTNEFLYSEPGSWRVKREIPFTNATKEYLASGDHIAQMTPTNRSSEPREAVSELVWIEAMISPLRIAQSWSLAKSDITLNDWISSLRNLKEPVKNAEGDELSAEIDKDQNVKVHLVGKIIADPKTKVGIDSTWLLTQRGKVKAEELHDSLIRSH